ncbi:MAG: transposase [Hyphomicrobium sp.]
MLDLGWLHKELAPYYSHTGRPSIDPELMMRMLIVGYVFAIRSERMLCREVQVNLAYRWYCKLGIEDRIPIILPSRAPGTSASAIAMRCAACSSGW